MITKGEGKGKCDRSSGIRIHGCVVRKGTMACRRTQRHHTVVRDNENLVSHIGSSELLLWVHIGMNHLRWWRAITIVIAVAMVVIRMRRHADKLSSYPGC